jgi:hypothetical protein
MVPLGPELAPGKSEPTTLDGFAALLGELVTLVAGGKPGADQKANLEADQEQTVDPAGAALVAACVVTPPPGLPLVGGVTPEAGPAAEGAPAVSTATTTTQPGRPSLPDSASPVARAAVLRHGPVATPQGRLDTRPADAPADPAPAVFAAVAERAALAPVAAVKATEAPAPAVPEPRDAIAPVPAAAPVADTHLTPVPAERPVERTEAVRPAILEAARGLRHEGNGRTSLVVRLNPPELGSVLVRLTVQDGRVDVQLRTPDLQAVGDLSAQSRDVQQVLKDSGFDLTSFDVTHGGIHDGQGEGKTPDRGTTQRDRRADGRPEAVHVTDDVPEARPAGTWL